MRLIILIGFVIGILSSCSTLDKSRMLKTPTNYKFKEFVDSVNYKKPYRIAVDDRVSIQMYSNDGYGFVGIGSQRGGQGGGQGGQGGSQGGGQGSGYKVRSDSTLKIPIIGKVKVVGLTLEEIEAKFEEILESHVNSPFVIAQIFNRRIYIFQGGYTASVFQLQNENTTLFEVLGQSGGVYSEGNASKIKIIRGNLKKPDIYMVNLSTIDGMQQANLNMQAGDIIYIDPFINYGARISSDIGSTLGFLSSLLLVYTLVQP